MKYYDSAFHYNTTNSNCQLNIITLFKVYLDLFKKIRSKNFSGICKIIQDEELEQPVYGFSVSCFISSTNLTNLI